jgi:TolB protein
MNYTNPKLFFVLFLFIIFINLHSCKKIFEPADPYNYKIAFVYKENYNYDPDLFIMDINGNNKIKLTYSPDCYSNPTFSHNGSKILFLKGCSPEYLCIINPDGSNIKNLSTHNIKFRNPSFSPDDSRIVCSGSIDDGTTSYIGGGIYIINIDDNILTQIVEEIHGPFNVTRSSPQYLPDGERILFDVRNSDENRHYIYIMNQDGTNQINLTPNSQSQLGTISLSPDGTKITYSICVNHNCDIGIMNIDGTNNIQITTDGDVYRFFEFSPDSKKLLYSTHSDTITQLCTINIDGSNKKVITSSDYYSWYDAVFSPDGKKIFYEHYYSIYVIDIDGKNKISLTNNDKWASSPDVGQIIF